MTWLSDWKKRIKLATDHTKIDEDLFNFPLLLGLNTCNAGVLFDELDYPSVDDDFTGSNGSAPNSDRWTSVSNCEIQSNKLRYPLSSAYACCNSVWRFNSDFDVQVDFDLITYPSTDKWWADLQIRFPNGDFFWVYRGYTGGAHKYVAQRKISGGYTIIGSAGTSDTSGKLRIVRLGTNYSLYYYNAGWVQLGSSYSYSAATQCQVKLECNVGDSLPECSHNFDNFKINSGTVIWPQNTHPNRKKIAATTNDGTTQCPVEIEQWDFYNGKVNLWTKIPTVTSGSDTSLYLYIDSDKTDNTSYVGDIASTPGKAVWNSNFVGVWHMCQDPTGGSGCIKDSTSNTNHGTSAGSMTSGDLVDGKIGKALDFNGSSNYLDIGIGTNLSPGTNSFTIESIFKSENTSWRTLYSKRNTTTTSVISLRQESSLKLGVYYKDSSSNTKSLLADSIVNDGILHYVAATRDGNNLSIILDTTIKTTTATLSGIDVSSAKSIIGMKGEGYTADYFDGILDEIRISNTARSASWIKATYYSNWDDLIVYEPYYQLYKYYFAGYTFEDSVPVSRIVRAYVSSTGRLTGEVTSSGNGYYQLHVSVSGSHYLVCMDADELPDYNNLIISRAIPYVNE